MNKKREFHVSANGFTIDGTKKVCCPECDIIASNYLEALEILDEFLKTKKLTDNIKLVTPIHLIDFPEE